MTQEQYTKQAMVLLKAKDGQSKVDAQIKAAMDKLAKARVANQAALDRVTVYQKRHRGLNEEAASLTGKYVERQNGLLDEYVEGCPPRDEFARTYDQLNCESRFIGAAIGRLVEHHLPLAHRGVLASQVFVAQSEYELVDAQALAAMFTRVKLVQPLLDHENEIEINGGTTERAIERAREALMAYQRLQDALSEYDERRKIQ